MNGVPKSLLCFLCLLGAAILAAGCRTSISSPGAAAAVREHGDIQWWREARYGLFVHYGPFSQGYEQGRKTIATSRPAELTTKDQQLAWTVHGLTVKPGFAKEWVQTAKAAGMKYIVFTAKHHEGFSLWDSKVNEYNSVRMGPHLDMVAEYAKACREAGLGVGIYYSLWDHHHPDGRTCAGDPAGRRRFLDYTAGMLRELMTNYGKIDILWYDAPTPLGYPGETEAAEINGMVRRLQPGILINNRSMRAEDFMSSENRISPCEYANQDWEACIAFRHGLWLWYPDPDTKFVTPRELIDMLQQCTASTGNLLFNVGPKPQDGTIWGPEKERLAAVGQWLTRNGEAVYGRVERVERLDWFTNSAAGGKWTRKGNTGYLWLPEWPKDGQIVLSGVHVKVTSASVLGTGQRLAVEQVASPTDNDKLATRVVIGSLPKECPDPLGYTVIKVQFQAYPQ